MKNDMGDAFGPGSSPKTIEPQAGLDASHSIPIALSALQQETLRALATEKAHWHRYMGRFNPTAHWSLAYKRRTKQMEALISRGLARRVTENRFGDAHAVITDAGRAWLAQGIVSREAIETEGLDPKGQSPVAGGNAPTTEGS